MVLAEEDVRTLRRNRPLQVIIVDILGKTNGIVDGWNAILFT